MRQTNKTPAGLIPTGASRDSCGGNSHLLDNPASLRIQHLIARHALTVETAAIIAALAFGGAA
jgi:hypothetical protein